DTLEDMFDFTNSPSLNTTVPTAPAPLPNDPGCPFVPTTTSTSTTTTTTTSSTTTTTFGCGTMPTNVCQASATAKGQLRFGSNGKLSWKWRSSAAVALSDFGSPAMTTDYVLCMYDQTGKKLGAEAPADGMCGTKPCWSTSGSTGFRYKDKDGTPDGLTKISLKSGEAGKAKISVKGSGTNLHLPMLPLTLPVRVQLRQSGSSTCWEASYSTATENGPSTFKAKSD